MSTGGGPPLIRLRYGAATDTGRLRPGNEDAVGTDADLGLFVVADGLGGHQAGEVASQVAVATFLASVQVAGGAGDDKREAVLLAAVADADAAVRDAASEPGRQGMASTLVAAWISGLASMWVVNVGDSRCYRYRDGHLAQLSLDHSALEDLRRAGRLPADRGDWPPRSALTQVVGLGEAPTPYTRHCQLVPGDRILLCSDGLTDMLSDAETGHLLSRLPGPQQACDRLIQEANWRGGLDNTTVVVIDALAAEPSTADWRACA